MNPDASPFWRTRFWQQWVVANAVGEFVGLGAVAALGFMAFKHAGEPANTIQALTFAATFVLLGAFEGAVVGVAQRAVLVRRLPALRGWIRATVAGAMAAWAIGMVPSTIVSLAHGPDTPAQAEPPLAMVLLLAAGLGAVAGPLLAAFQWHSLRKVVTRRAWLWLPANAAAWALGMPIIFLGAQSNELTSAPAVIVAVMALTLLAAGAVVGAVHGWFLLHMVFPSCAGENTA
ncbi:MAG: hypothetical protein OEW35_15850 [Gammaproteobacteria bacterium]|nr:hypothetical protein [Gammaproteobacteria bacterium]